MKIPKSFKPNKNLESKTKQLTEKAKIFGSEKKIYGPIKFDSDVYKNSKEILEIYLHILNNYEPTTAKFDIHSDKEYYVKYEELNEELRLLLSFPDEE